MLRAGPRLVVLAGCLLVGAFVLADGVPVERSAAQSSRHEVLVTVVDEDGKPVEGLRVVAEVHGGGPGEYEQQVTGAGGALSLWLVEGEYGLNVHSNRYSDCTVHGPENAEGVWRAVIAVEGSGSSQIRIVLARKRPLDGVFSVPCHFDVPYYRVQGTILGPGDEPLEGISVLPFGPPLEGPRPAAVTAPDGSYAVEVPDGSYWLQVFVTIEGTRCVLGFAGWDGAYSYGYTGFKRRIDIQDAGVSGLTVRLPGTPEDLCRRVEGRVSDSSGEPLEGVQFHANGRGRLLGRNISVLSDEQGAFAFYGPDGTYEINVFTTAGSECTVRGMEQPRRGSTTALSVAGADLGGIGLVVSGDESDARQEIMCLRPPEVVTTNLLPGWNLVGWTEAEADIAAIFEAIPQLESAHAWDAGTQAFTEASRSGAGIAGALSTLQPGTGLWLYLGGTEPVEWTRQNLVETALVQLEEGWNLVGWSGRVGASPEDILGSLGQALGGVATWEAATEEFLLYVPGSPANGHTPQRINRGDGLWLHTSKARQWLQPGGFEPPIEYHPDVALETRAPFPDAVDSVLAYFAYRFGLFVPSVEVYVGDDIGRCGFYALPTIVLSEGCVHAMAHEYVHAIQAHVAGGGGTAPTWLTEGMAERWEGQYDDYIGHRTYSERQENYTRPFARRTETPLARMEGYNEVSYTVANLAVDWLVQLTGESSLLEYYRQRFSHGTWQEAFENAFGMGVDDFYTSFAAHRAEVAAPFPTVTGIVFDEQGQPWQGVTVHVRAVESSAEWKATTGADGRFEAKAPADAYQVVLMTEQCVMGWYVGEQGFSESRDDAKVLSVETGDIDDLILRPPNNCARIEGTIVGPDGEPMEGLQLQGIPADGGGFWSFRTNESGRFDTVVTVGVYRVRLLANRCPLDWTPNARGMSPLDGFYRRLSIQPAGVTGLTLTLSSLPSDLCRRLEGSAVGSDGQPIAGLQVNLTEKNGGGFFATRSGDDGSFSFSVRDGSYAFSVASDRSNTCRAGGLAPSRRGSDDFTVAGEDVVGIRIVVSGQPPERPGWTYCTLAE
ncbi:MAG: carboxypeptidase regulatory-like domain-containing protein [Dehalococcoidia bacterium]|nr:carboxypeptidase regulatory-like domain-containing protein [Dehalococcoidia bacterium]MYI85994.1 carboxypeptidase regulatory-like domain-containing protein [Dehalococcoidia bacterium]